MRIVVVALFLVVASPLLAHSPVINDRGEPMTVESPYIIEEPEHSKAIFSELDGDPHYYQIVSPTPFKFYAGLTAPKLETCDLSQTFDLEILDYNRNQIDERSGGSMEWWPWYEEYGKTWYWVGPEIGKDFKSDRVYEAGTYYVKVSSSGNVGKYVLAVGDEERFGFSTIASMLLKGTMGKIRDVWWNEDYCKE
jgi:hypothetical protein